MTQGPDARNETQSAAASYGALFADLDRAGAVFGGPTILTPEPEPLPPLPLRPPEAMPPVAAPEPANLPSRPETHHEPAVATAARFGSFVYKEPTYDELKAKYEDYQRSHPEDTLDKKKYSEYLSMSGALTSTSGSGIAVLSAVSNTGSDPFNRQKAARMMNVAGRVNSAEPLTSANDVNKVLVSAREEIMPSDSEAALLVIQPLTEEGKTIIGKAGDVSLHVVDHDGGFVEYYSHTSKNRPTPNMLSDDTAVIAKDIAEIPFDVPVRLVGANGGASLTWLRKNDSKAFATAMAASNPEECATAITNLASKYYNHGYPGSNDYAFVVVDIDPGKQQPAVTPSANQAARPDLDGEDDFPLTPPAPGLDTGLNIEMPFNVGNYRPHPNPHAGPDTLAGLSRPDRPQGPPDPRLDPVPLPPPAYPQLPPLPPYQPTSPAHDKIRIYEDLKHTSDASSLRTLLAERAMVLRLSLDDPATFNHPKFQTEIESLYNNQLRKFKERAANRHDSSFGGAQSLQEASTNFKDALALRNVVKAIQVEIGLRGESLTDAERDQRILEQISLDMVGNNGSLEGIVGSITTEIYNDRMQRLGWIEDGVSGMLPPGKGFARFVNAASRRWARWGRGKRAAFSIAAGLAVSAGVAATGGLLVGAVGATAGPMVGAVFSRSVRGATMKLDKDSTILNSAESERDAIDERVASLYVKNTQDPNARILNILSSGNIVDAYVDAANESHSRNFRRAAIGAAVLIASTAGGELLKHLVFNGHHSPSGGRPTGNRPSAPSTPRPSGTPSASAPAHPVAPPSHVPSAAPTHSPESNPTTTPTHQPSSAPTTKTPSPSPTHTPGNGSSNPGNGPAPKHNPTGGKSTGKGGSHPGSGKTPEAPGTGNDGTVLTVHPGENVSDVIAHANGHFAENWQAMTDAAKAAHQAGQLRTIYNPNGSYYYQTLVNGHWTDNTKDVVATLVKNSKGKLTLSGSKAAAKAVQTVSRNLFGLAV